MKKSEHGGVPSLLNGAISNWMAGSAPRRKQTAAAKKAAHETDVMQQWVRVGNPNVASVEVNTRLGDTGPSDEEEDSFKEYKVKQLLRSRCEEGEK